VRAERFGVSGWLPGESGGMRVSLPALLYTSRTAIRGDRQVVERAKVILERRA
jgi:hypothetical protein